MRSSIHANSVYQHFPVNVKHVISSLWVAIMFCYVYGDYIQIYIPGEMANAMVVSAEKQGIQFEFFAVALLMAIPSVMIFFTLVLPAKINRRLNIIIPALYVALLIGLNTETMWHFYLFLTVVEILLSLTTISYAWRWPKIKPST